MDIYLKIQRFLDFVEKLINHNFLSFYRCCLEYIICDEIHKIYVYIENICYRRCNFAFLLFI